MIKQLIIILLVLLGTNRIFCQNLNSNIYNHNGITERTKYILDYNNGYLVLSGIKEEQGVPPTGILIRHIDKNGELLWTDFYKDETDSLNYYLGGNAIIVADRMLYVFGSAQDVNLDITPTFFKYDLKQKKVIDFKLYNSEFGGTFYNAHLHNDGRFYAGGKIYKDINHIESDILFMKIDRKGKVIWEREYRYRNRGDVTDIESFENELIIAGRFSFVNEGSTVYLSKIDTSGEVLNFNPIFEFGDVGATELEVHNGELYFTRILCKRVFNF